MVSRHIPEAVKQEVRRKCGFGCVVCGIPIFEYDHLVDFAEVGEHDPSNINLLCPTHHSQKTTGLLSRAAVAKYAAAPVNRRADHTQGLQLHLNGSTVNFLIGSCEFRNSFPGMWPRFDGVVLNGVSMFGASVEDGWLKFDLILTNERGERILEVEESEIRASTALWDYQKIGNRFLVQERHGSARIVMTVEDNTVRISSVQFVHTGTYVRIDDEGASFGRVLNDAPPLRPVYMPRGKIAKLVVAECRYGIVNTPAE